VRLRSELMFQEAIFTKRCHPERQPRDPAAKP
jgi:hypothetical protein